MTELDDALRTFSAAQANLVSASKRALTDVLSAVFSNPEVTDVAWGQKTSEYNDEGMYPGIMGPVINEFSIVNDETGEVEETDLDDWWSKLYDGYPPRTTYKFPVERAKVAAILEAIGPEILCEIVGDDEHVVIAERDNRRSDGFTLWSEDVRY